jgi:hypothetical protein
MIPLQATGFNLAPFADDACLYAAERKEGLVVRKFERGLSSMTLWCEQWNLKTN